MNPVRKSGLQSYFLIFILLFHMKDTACYRKLYLRLVNGTTADLDAETRNPHSVQQFVTRHSDS